MQAAVLLQKFWQLAHNFDISRTRAFPNMSVIASRRPKILPSMSVASSRNLTTLSFSSWAIGNSAYPVFFEKAEFPNLERLILDGGRLDFDPRAWPPPSVDKFLSTLPSLERLKHISISHSPIVTDTLQQILAATPHVTSLDAEVYLNFEGFFEVLNTDIYPNILPKLETLILEVGHSAATVKGEGETIDAESLYRNVLKPRVLSSSFECRLRKIIVYASEEGQVGDDVPFVKVVRQCATDRGLEFERRVVKEERKGKLHSH